MILNTHCYYQYNSIHQLLYLNYQDETIISFESLEHILTELILHTVFLSIDLLPLQILLRQIFLRHWVEGYWRSYLTFPQILYNCWINVVQKFLRILIRPLLNVEMQLVIIMFIRRIVWIFIWYVIIHLNSKDNWRFISPTSWHILDGIPTSPQNNSRNTKSKHIVYTFCMTFHW